MRVQFFVNTMYNTHSRNRSTLVEIIREIIGITDDQARHLRSGGGARLECSTEQFARFIIARCDVGLQNTIRDLRAEIVPDLPVWRATKDEVLHDVYIEPKHFYRVKFPKLEDVVNEETWTEIDLSRFTISLDDTSGTPVARIKKRKKNG